MKYTILVYESAEEQSTRHTEFCQGLFDSYEEALHYASDVKIRRTPESEPTPLQWFQVVPFYMQG
jgi:hypothetical protein